MIHPSTMAGPNWFTGSFGTTNPFQQNSSTFFRNTTFPSPQGGFGTGNNPFSNPSFGFGTNPTQIQNQIYEIARQTIPTVLAGFGFSTTNGFQPSFGPQGTLGFQTPFTTQSAFGFQTPFGSTAFGPQLQGGFGTSTSGQFLNLSFFTEIIRQATNQAIQNTFQQNPTSFSSFSGMGTTPFTGTTNTFGTSGQQQNMWGVIAQYCQQACFTACQTLCQAVVTGVNECLNQQNTSFGTGNTFGTNWQNQSQQQNLWNFIAQCCQQACQVTCQTICQCALTCANACLNQQSPSFSPQGTFGTSPQQQNPWGFIAQCCQQACQICCQTLCQAVTTCVSQCLNQQGTAFNTGSTFGTNWQTQNFWNFTGQVCQQACQATCQTICDCMIAGANVGLSQQNTSSPTSFFNTPFTFSNSTSQFGTTSGIPTGAGAF